MKVFVFFLLAIPATLASPFLFLQADEEPDDYSGYRLEGIQVPSLYHIEMNIRKGNLEGTDTIYEGSVQIYFHLTEDSSILELHNMVNITTCNILNGNRTKRINIAEQLMNETSQILNLELDEYLESHSEYIFTAYFTGVLDTTQMHGFYRSEYIDENGTKQYLLTTQFEPTFARYAFPCFDEPKYKAQFELVFSYPKGYNVLANVAAEDEPRILKNGNEKVKFLRTAKMSTYLLAFIVSKFDCTSGVNFTDNIPYRVCSRNESAEDRQLAVDYGTPIMNVLEGLSGIKFSQLNISKMDQVAIPDFPAGAMENWGLVTYRELALLWNPTDSSNSQKQRVLSIIAHEFTHTWFGNLVTMEWWDYLFLNEGFARYFQYFALTYLDELSDWEMHKQFVVEEQQVVFVLDADKSTPALSSRVATPTQIDGKFSSISYNKGASIIRMVTNIMGNENFISGIRSYIKTYANSTALPSYLWAQLANHMDNNTLPIGVNLDTVMKNWIGSSGYPLVTVTTNGNDVIISQKRFLYKDVDYTHWYVPISYTKSSDLEKFSSTSPVDWLLPSNDLVLSEALKDNEWIILNNRASGYYRVNYDLELWKRIKNILATNVTLIDELNRAQIVDDLLNLARANEIKYSTALDILTYLKNETNYYPWHAAIRGFEYLLGLFGRSSEIGELVNDMVIDFLDNVYSEIQIQDLNEMNHLNVLRFVMIWENACKMGIENCVRKCQKLFAEFKENETRVDRNMRHTVYCNALRYSDDIKTDWNILWQEFETTKSASEQSILISALGCTRDPTVLANYLDKSLNDSSGIRRQDLTAVWNSVYSSNEEGVDASLDYFIENHKKIYDYTTLAPTFISNIISYFTTLEQIDKIEQFVQQKEVHPVLKIKATTAVKTARSKLRTAEEIRPEFEQFFNITTTTVIPSTTTTNTMLPSTTTTATTTSTTISTTEFPQTIHSISTVPSSTATTPKVTEIPTTAIPSGHGRIVSPQYTLMLTTAFLLRLYYY